MATAANPRTGMLATVRNRRGVVSAVEPYDGTTEGRIHLVTIEYIDADGPLEDRVIWEREIDGTLLEPTALPDVHRAPAMPGADFDALVRATRWSAVAPFVDPDGSEGPLDRLPLIAPFHGAIQVEDCQLVPLLKALRMPRVSLLLADDVGLGKTIEAGLILSELILRRRVRRAMILCPASLRTQWQDEMRSKFSLAFDIVDRDATHALRRQLGLDANPWRAFSRVITSYDYSGVTGAETACLVRRLRTFCGRDPQDVVCVATSATLADAAGDGEDARVFAARFFGIDATAVQLVREVYAPEMWAWPRQDSAALANPSQHLRAVLQTLSLEGDGGGVATAARALLGRSISASSWEADLYSVLSAHEGVFQTAEALKLPRLVSDLITEVSTRLNRDVSEEEVLCWLLLGAAARKDDRPLLRPVVHGFIRGVGGAVVTFPDPHERPRLWLSAEEEQAEHEGEQASVRLPVLTCNTCGQHYFEHVVEDFEFGAKVPGGGVPTAEGGRYWPAKDLTVGGRRVVLFDRLSAEGDDDHDDAKGAAAVWLCPICGALHPDAVMHCRGCGHLAAMVPLSVVRGHKDHPGHLTRCLSCAAPGRARGSGYREPARPVRSVNVADVHVLAQEMLRYAERKRLLVFADNRQDAAFQAGWMRDHARRFRLRALMAERIDAGTISVGDLVAELDRRLDDDDPLSRALARSVGTASEGQRGTVPQR